MNGELGQSDTDKKKMVKDQLQAKSQGKKPEPQSIGKSKNFTYRGQGSSNIHVLPAFLL